MGITIDPVLLPYLGSALARMRYLYPDIEFVVKGNVVEVAGKANRPSAAAERDVLYALYREKIYAETLPLRRALIEAVTSK